MQNFIAIAIFIGDGLYNFLKICILSLQVPALKIFNISIMPTAMHEPRRDKAQATQKLCPHD